jgi:hypothetical protein
MHIHATHIGPLRPDQAAQRAKLLPGPAQPPTTTAAAGRSANASAKPVSGPKTAATEGDSAVPASTITDPEKARGVIRLLQEGHFKGVADVRLRINFFDELHGLQTAADSAHVQSLLEQVAADVQAAVAAFVQENPLEEPGAAGFEALRATLEQAIQGAAGGAPATLIDELTSAFEAFIADASTLFPPPEPLELEEPATVESPLQPLAAALQALLDKATQDITNPPSLLPPLSEPSGNGRAYAKFLALYQGLLGGSEPQSNEPPLDLSL